MSRPVSVEQWSGSRCAEGSTHRICRTGFGDEGEQSCPDWDGKTPGVELGGSSETPRADTDEAGRI